MVTRLPVRIALVALALVSRMASAIPSIAPTESAPCPLSVLRCRQLVPHAWLKAGFRAAVSSEAFRQNEPVMTFVGMFKARSVLALRSCAVGLSVLACSHASSSEPVKGTVSTYEAIYRWDLAIYLARADLRIWVDGREAGRAVYDSLSGGANMNKFIRTEPKLIELVDLLFPKLKAYLRAHPEALRTAA